MFVERICPRLPLALSLSLHRSLSLPLHRPDPTHLGGQGALDPSAPLIPHQPQPHDIGHTLLQLRYPQPPVSPPLPHPSALTHAPVASGVTAGLFWAVLAVDMPRPSSVQ